MSQGCLEPGPLPETPDPPLSPVPWVLRTNPLIAPNTRSISSLGCHCPGQQFPRSWRMTPSRANRVCTLSGGGATVSPPHTPQSCTKHSLAVFADIAQNKTLAHKGEQERRATGPCFRDLIRLEPICVWATCRLPSSEAAEHRGAPRAGLTPASPNFPTFPRCLLRTRGSRLPRTNGGGGAVRGSVSPSPCWAVWVRREGLGDPGPSAGEWACHLGSVSPAPAPSPELAGIGMHHKSPGRRSCDWIIYSSRLTFLTRKYHTKGKVMKSHLSCLSLTCKLQGFPEALLAEGGMREAAPLPSLPPPVSHPRLPTPPLHTLRHTPSRSPLAHTLPPRCTDSSVLWLCLWLWPARPARALPTRPDTPRTSSPLPFHSLPPPLRLPGSLRD